MLLMSFSEEFKFEKILETMKPNNHHDNHVNGNSFQTKFLLVLSNE